MPCDPNLPQENTLCDAGQVRAPLQGLKALVDAIAATFAAQIAGVSTPNPGAPATVSVSVIGNTLRFSSGIPRGNDGMQGIPGDPGMQGPPFANDPPTLADMEVMRAKVNELILAQRR